MSDIRITVEMWYDLLERVSALEKKDAILGPQKETPIEAADREAEVAKIVDAAVEAFTVDRSARVLTDNSPVPEDGSHKEIEPDTGMQKGYIVLTEAERHKGFVRPLRRAYKHTTCGCLTTMALSIAETLARDPGFYAGGFCANCKAHFPNEEFVWPDDGTTVGT